MVAFDRVWTLMVKVECNLTKALQIIDFFCQSLDCSRRISHLTKRRFSSVSQRCPQ